MNAVNPYRGVAGQWLRGSFHGHCAEHSGCASVRLEKSVKMYADLGVGFMAVTDHDCVTNLDRMRSLHPEMIFLEGFEYTRCENLLFIGEKVPDLYEFPLPEALKRADGLLSMVCHPDPFPGRVYWSIEKIRALGHQPDGMEVYNGHYDSGRLSAQGHVACYTRIWDEALSSGLRLWGFANDDFHDADDFNRAFNMVCVKERTPAAVIDAARRGASYGSTGLLLEEVAERDGAISIRLDAPAHGRFIGPHGRVFAASDGCRFEYTMDTEDYVRFEAEGESGRIFLQPIFADRGGALQNQCSPACP